MGALTIKQQILAGLVIAAVAALLGATVAWQWQDNKFTRQLAEQSEAHGATLDEINRKSAAAQQEVDERYRRKVKELNDEYAALYGEYTDAKAIADGFANDLAVANERLSIRTTGCSGASGQVPSTAASGSVVHGTGRADIDPRDAAAIIRLTNRGDEAIRRLKACQAYANKVSSE